MVNKENKQRTQRTAFTAGRVIGRCQICGGLIEPFDTYYILDSGEICHDYCFEFLDGESFVVEEKSGDKQKK